MGCVVCFFQNTRLHVLPASYGKQTIMETLIKQLRQVVGFLTIPSIPYFFLHSTDCRPFVFLLNILLDFFYQPHLAKPQVTI